MKNLTETVLRLPVVVAYDGSLPRQINLRSLHELRDWKDETRRIV